jgi:hypothetical protein
MPSAAHVACTIRAALTFQKKKKKGSFETVFMQLKKIIPSVDFHFLAQIQYLELTLGSPLIETFLPIFFGCFWVLSF